MATIDTSHSTSPIAWASGVVSNNEPAQKTIKLASVAIEIYNVQQNTKSFVTLAGKLKATDHFCDFLAFFSVSKGILYADDKGKYIWTDAKQTPLGICEKVTLFALKLFVFVTDVKFGFMDKGFLANKIGPIVIYSGIIDALVVVFSSLSIANTFLNEIPNLLKKTAVTNDKLAKWDAKKTILASARLIDTVDCSHDIEVLKKHYLGDVTTPAVFSNHQTTPAVYANGRAEKLGKEIQKVTTEIAALNAPVTGSATISVEEKAAKLETLEQQRIKLLAKQAKALVIEEALKSNDKTRIATALGAAPELQKAKDHVATHKHNAEVNAFDKNNLWWENSEQHSKNCVCYHRKCI